MNAPQRIHAIRAERVIVVTWSEDHVGHYPFRMLRISCRCANCVHEMTGEPLLDPDKVPDSIDVTDMQPVGNYALKIAFSDGHDTGLFTWQRLRELCPCPTCQAG